MDKNFQGEVYLSDYMTSLMVQFPELSGNIINDFKTYWRNGHHPDFGKDAPLHDPAAIRQSAVRHVHIIPIPVSPKDDPRWLKPFHWLIPTRRPASNSWLVYCVTESRNCCLLAFLNGDAHFMARQGFFVGRMIDSAEAFFDRMEEYPLSEGEHAELFEDKWQL